MSKPTEKEFSDHIDNLDNLSLWLNDLYHEPDMGVFFERPVLSMLITAADYLSANLSKMKKRFLD